MNVCSMFTYEEGICLSGITKVIDELGLMIIAKNIELEKQQEEINSLKRKIELIEQYLDTYESFYDKKSDK